MDKPCLGKIKERYTIVCSECHTGGEMPHEGLHLGWCPPVHEECAG